MKYNEETQNTLILIEMEIWGFLGWLEDLSRVIFRIRNKKQDGFRNNK